MANEFARYLRKEMTDAERMVWARIRYRQIKNLKFRRQVPIGPYIADFVCHEIRLIIEIDGGQHAEQIEADTARTRCLEAEGYRVVRFWNHEIFEDWDGVAEKLWGLASSWEVADDHEKEGVSAKRNCPLSPCGDVAAERRVRGGATAVGKAHPPPGEQSLADLPHKGGGEYQESTL